MEWTRPELIALAEDSKDRMNDYLNLMALVDASADIDDIVGIVGPQELSEIETCAAYCQHPCMQGR